MIAAGRLRTGRIEGLTWLCLGVSLWLAPLSQAVEVENLYTVEVPMDRAARDPQNAAYERALREVLVRITGSEAAARSPELEGIFPTPSRYVLQYGPGENDSLVVALDGPAIEALLQRAGQPVWGSDRPLTLVWLAVDRGAAGRDIIAADDGLARADAQADDNNALREQLSAAARRRGLPVLFPLMDTEDRQGISFSDIWGGFAEPVRAASRRYGTASVLVGRLRVPASTRSRWSYSSGGQQREWSGSPEEVVNQLADALADQYAVSGNAPVGSVLLTVSGIDSVQAYGSVQKLLAETTMIDSYRVDTVAGADIRFQVSVRGGADRLRSALEFSGELEPAGWDGGNDYLGGAPRGESLQYVYRPFLDDFGGRDSAGRPEDSEAGRGREFD